MPICAILYLSPFGLCRGFIIVYILILWITSAQVVVIVDRLFIPKYLEQYYDELEPFDFYRNIFPIGDLEEAGKQEQGKYNAIAVELFPKDSKYKAFNYVITDDLEKLNQLLSSDNFIIISPISYIGKNRTADNARYIYAMAIDLDGITEEHYLIDLLHQIKIEYIPKPTYIVWSGTGIHLYYQFIKPIPCYKHITDRLSELKKALTNKIWNTYTTSLSNKIQLESLFQGFRLVGGITKNGNRTRAFSIGDKVSIDYLNDFVEKEYRLLDFEYKNDLTLEKAKKLYPEWYEKRIINKEKRGRWITNKAVYDWWKRKLTAEIKEGHRYYGVMVLAVYAKKCNIPFDRLEQDAYGLIELMEQLTITEENHFTTDDILSALEMYNDNYITFPIDSITMLTDINIEKNKRNYRKQEIHLKLARANKMILKEEGLMKKEGRPSKEKIVIEWRIKNPTKKKSDCIKETGLSKPTVSKHWDKVVFDNE